MRVLSPSAGFAVTGTAAPTYWLTRWCILRLLGLVYAVAFLVAINQLLPLIGSDGLLPLSLYFDRVAAALGTKTAGCFRLPSLFWFSPSNSTLMLVSWTGFLLSLLAICGYTNAIILLLLWILYMSIVNAGQEWYGYGWEIQLLETGFLAIFLCPLTDMRPFPRRPPPFAIIVLFRWLICRIMLGAGLIKLRGDEAWRNGTALYYHFETQPLPGPLSRWLHFLPKTILRMGVWYNFLAELLAPLLVFWPRVARHIAGILIVVLQLILILSGNLSFLNWLTLVPAIACFDDGALRRVLPRKLAGKAAAAATTAEMSRPMVTVSLIVTCLVAVLSIAPVVNLLSPGQVMNTSFDRLNLVNTYGAFGSVGRERMNIVFEGTTDRDATDSAHWIPYVYKGLPVLPENPPPQVAPYQLRFDWQMWFAAMGSVEDYPWTLNLVYKLLQNNPSAASLFANRPFTTAPPRYIRAVLYRYSFVPPGNGDNLYWKREKIGEWLPPMSLESPLLLQYQHENK